MRLNKVNTTKENKKNSANTASVYYWSLGLILIWLFWITVVNRLWTTFRSHGISRANVFVISASLYSPSEFSGIQNKSTGPQMELSKHSRSPVGGYTAITALTLKIWDKRTDFETDSHKTVALRSSPWTPPASTTKADSRYDPVKLRVESSLDIGSRRRTRCTVTTAPMGRRYTTPTAADSAV